MISRKAWIWFDTTAEPLWRPCRRCFGYHSCCWYGWDYGTYVDDEYFDIHDYDDDTDHDIDDDIDDDTDEDDTNDDNGDVDGGGRGNLYTIKAQRSRLKNQGSRLKD